MGNQKFVPVGETLNAKSGRILMKGCKHGVHKGKRKGKGKKTRPVAVNGIVPR